jgi:hypothetical protein
VGSAFGINRWPHWHIAYSLQANDQRPMKCGWQAVVVAPDSKPSSGVLFLLPPGGHFMYCCVMRIVSP